MSENDRSAVAAEARAHRIAVLQALFVTFLWSTSWVFIKLGLRELTPLAFAGLRYALAAVLLLPFALADGQQRKALAALGRGDRLRLAALGITLYALTQGAQFAALAMLPAASVGLVLVFTPLAVALAAAPLLGERPRPAHWAGLVLFLGGAVVYFGRSALPDGERKGLVVALVALAANAAAALLGRAVNRQSELSPLTVTALSMSLGAVALLAVALVREGAPRPGPTGWAIVAWLATVNTAWAFTLWNRTLRRLSAAESSLINNTMLGQVALLAWIFLGESLGGRELVGLGIALGGVLVAQRRAVRS